MSNKVLKGIGKVAGNILEEVVRRSSAGEQPSGNSSENTSDLIIDNITGILGGGGKGKGRSGGAQGSGRGQGGGGRRWA